MSLKILIVDDHRLSREAIRTALKFCNGDQPEIVGEAADGANGLELARTLHPDVVTMDVSLPDINGLEVTRRISAEMPDVKIVVVSMHSDWEYQHAAIKAGASSYISKMHLIDELPACLNQLAGMLSTQSAGHNDLGP